jgi:hypothetical protein
MADQLATREDLASSLQQTVDNSSADLAIEVCTAVVQAATGQKILRVTDDSEIVYGTRDPLLRLKQRPIVSITSVTYNGTLLTQGTAWGNWAAYPEGVWRYLGWTECWGPPASATVVYTHGYAPGAQELQVARGAVLSLARGLFQNPSGVTSEKIDDYAVAYDAASTALAAAPSLRALLRKQYGPKARMVSVV